jgi:hypothetical protein
MPPTNTVILSNQEIGTENEEFMLVGSTVDHEYHENEEEMPQPPRKRRVVGTIRRRPALEPIQRPDPIVMSPAIPSPAQFMAEMYQQPTRYPQQQQRITVEQSVKERVKADVLYMQMMDREQRRMQQKPRMSISQVCLKVANDHARGSGSSSVNGISFQNPRVVPIKTIKVKNMNQIIQKISPKAITPKKKKGFAF